MAANGKVFSEKRLTRSLTQSSQRHFGFPNFGFVSARYLTDVHAVIFTSDRGESQIGITIYGHTVGILSCGGITSSSYNQYESIQR